MAFAGWGFAFWRKDTEIISDNELKSMIGNCFNLFAVTPLLSAVLSTMYANMDEADGTKFDAGDFTSTPNSNDEYVTIYEVVSDEGGHDFAELAAPPPVLVVPHVTPIAARCSVGRLLRTCVDW